MLYELFANKGIAQGTAIGVEALIVCVAVFLLTLLATRLILPLLRAKKLNQPINMYVTEHAGKAGTPTMGGICFIIASLLAVLVWIVLEKCGVIGANDSRALLPFVLTVCLGVANGLIGFIDDYKKLVKKENEGLNEAQKFMLQLFVAAAYLAMMGMTGNLPTALKIPFIDLSLELGWFAYVVYLIVIVGFVNSTNITDGIDGLASSVGAAVSMALIVMAVILGARYTGVAAGVLLGSLLGFLVFNHYPAKVFMGDTGSLFIGGIIMGCAISEGQLIAVIVMSFVFIFEMLSSLLQRVYFKLTHGKRIFKKAPVHHHFQLLGWSEVKIVTVFFIVSVALCAVAMIGIVI
ncbi:MAG: phospho-N-acetylmuramoyl-pentapeptide-transferase [Clostridia bacterium]|nr:phospho-N-acetylmuramoyl-pentapeptide-transferase [Clostridia bacterium]